MIKYIAFSCFSLFFVGIVFYGDSNVKLVSETKVIVEEVTSLKEIIARNKIVVVNFGAPWCGPCMALQPQFKLWANKHPEAKFVKVNIDNASNLAKEYKVEYVPQIFVIKGNKMILLSSNTEESIVNAINNLN